MKTKAMQLELAFSLNLQLGGEIHKRNLTEYVKGQAREYDRWPSQIHQCYIFYSRSSAQDRVEDNKEVEPKVDQCHKPHFGFNHTHKIIIGTWVEAFPILDKQQDGGHIYAILPQ